MGPAAGVGWAIPAPSSLQGGTWLEPPPPPPHQWTAAAEPIAKKPNKNIEIILELGNPTPGRINSDLKLVYNTTTSTTYKFRSKNL